jgi:hypothetical protein
VRFSQDSASRQRGAGGRDPKTENHTLNQQRHRFFCLQFFYAILQLECQLFGSPSLMVISFAYLNDWSNAEII